MLKFYLPIERQFIQVIHLPNSMATVSLSSCAGKYIPIYNLSDVNSFTIALIFGVKALRMLFVHGFGIDAWLFRRKCQVMPDFLIGRLIGAMTCLMHIKVQPILLMKPIGTAAECCRLGMKTHQLFISHTLSFMDSSSDFIPDFYVL